MKSEGRGGGSSAQAAELMDLLGLGEDELCRILDVGPLALISGRLEHAHQLPILLDLLAEPRDRVGAPVLRRWLRAGGPQGRPLDALLDRDFARFEDAVGELEDRGFVLRTRRPS